MGKNSAAKQSNRIAEQQRADEEARQARIRKGTQDINGIFDGRTVGTGEVTSFDPNATYYNADGSVWTPTIVEQPSVSVASMATGMNAGTPVGMIRDFGKNGSGGYIPDPNAARNGNNAAARAAKTAPRQSREQLLQAEFEKNRGNLRANRVQQGGFNDQFYEGQKKAYMDYANPQLQAQQDEAAKQLTFALARSGNLQSSARGQLEGKLAETGGIQAQAISDQAQQYATDARNAVEGARGDLIASLNASGDAEGASKNAMAKTAALSATPAFNPLTNLFADFTNSIGAQQAATQARAAQAPAGGASTASYYDGAGRDAVRVRG